MSPLNLLFFQTEQSQFSAAPHKMLQTLHQNCCISLDMLQGFDVFLIMKRPKLNTVRLVWPHQGWVWTITSLLLLKHYDISLDTIGLLGHLDTLLLCWVLTKIQVLFPPHIFPITLPKACSIAWSYCDQHFVFLNFIYTKIPNKPPQEAYIWHNLGGTVQCTPKKAWE